MPRKRADDITYSLVLAAQAQAALPASEYHAAIMVANLLHAIAERMACATLDNAIGDALGASAR